MTTYPNSPGSKVSHPETSIAAGIGLRDAAIVLRKKAENILGTFVNVTADEAAKFLGVSVLAMRPRFSELVKQGKAEDSGIRRRNDSGRMAAAWRATRPTGQQEMKL